MSSTLPPSQPQRHERTRVQPLSSSSSSMTAATSSSSPPSTAATRTSDNRSGSGSVGHERTAGLLTTPVRRGAAARTSPRRPRMRRDDDDNDDDMGSDVATSSTTTTTSADADAAETVRQARRRNVDALLRQLPSSPRQLLARMQRQRDELRALRDENVALRAREVEVSALAVRLQEHFAATQSQVENIKAHVHRQLAQPVSDDEVARIEAVPDAQRDLLDTIKLGIHRQLYAAQSTSAAATRRASELATRVAALTQELSDVRAQLVECAATARSEREAHAAQLQQREHHAARALELEATVKDLQTRLRGVYVDHEQLLSAKLTAQTKTDEVARLGVRVEELELDVARHKTAAECAEQKLDILKSEFYDLKLQYTQRVAALEAALRTSEEKLRGLGELELESELFISNLAQQQEQDDNDDDRNNSKHNATLLPRRRRDGDDGDAQTYTTTAASYTGDDDDGAAVGCGTRGGRGVDVACWLAMPRSRKLAHTLRVTKRCLHLENKTASLSHELAFKEKQLARLRLSLEAARDALNNVNSPYALVEKTVTTLQDENAQLHEQVRVLSEEKRQLREALQQRTADVQTLCRHRKELLRMKRVLQQQLGLVDDHAASVTDATANAAGSPTLRRLAQQSQLQSQLQSQPLPPTATLTSAATHATTASTQSTAPSADAAMAPATTTTTTGAPAATATSLGSPLQTIHILS